MIMINLFAITHVVYAHTIVFGWRELANNRMLEQGQRYDFEVAYIKRGSVEPSTEITFSVTDIEGTASVLVS